MKNITHHHDGHGLNESIELYAADERDPKGGNASHHYQAEIKHVHGLDTVLSVQFQHGARDALGSIPGATDAVVLDRYEGFQSGPHACRENALVVTKLQEAIHWMKHRADERARRGVLGKNKK